VENEKGAPLSFKNNPVAAAIAANNATSEDSTIAMLETFMEFTSEF
jgi:hypothetical protein